MHREMDYRCHGRNRKRNAKCKMRCKQAIAAILKNVKILQEPLQKQKEKSYGRMNTEWVNRLFPKEMLSVPDLESDRCHGFHLWDEKRTGTIFVATNTKLLLLLRGTQILTILLHLGMFFRQILYCSMLLVCVSTS